MTDELKRRMSIALVGIRPADQVVLKGYLRVLLRLDVELIWATATDRNIDLFVINNEFRNANSVVKLLEINKATPVLYVKRDDNGAGGIAEDVLTIPLKQINVLNDWLVLHVPTLTQAPMPRTETPTSTPTATKQPEPVKPQAQVAKPEPVNLQALVEMIKTLQARPQENFELMDGDKLVAIIDAHRQMIWLQGSVSKLTADYHLQPYQGELPDDQIAKDSAHFLWLLTWHNPDVLLPLMDNNSRHKLRYWAKPPTSLRRDLLHVMTAIEQESMSASEIASRTGVSVLTAKKALIALLVSGNLTDDSYRTLSYRAKLQPQSIAVEPTTKVEPTSEPVLQAKDTEQDAKTSFLSKLRRKLGI